MFRPILCFSGFFASAFNFCALPVCLLKIEVFKKQSISNSGKFSSISFFFLKKNKIKKQYKSNLSDFKKIKCIPICFCSINCFSLFLFGKSRKNKKLSFFYNYMTNKLVNFYSSRDKVEIKDNRINNNNKFSLSCKEQKIMTAKMEQKKNNSFISVISAGEKLNLLRQEMKKYGVDVYLIYTCDQHNTEVTADYDARRAFISNFTGSAGTAVVTLSSALLWTDGRYANQAATELDASAGWVLMKAWLKETPGIADWIEMQDNVRVVGIDPYRTTIGDYKKLLKLKKKKIEVKLLEKNLIDNIWTEKLNRPKFPMSELFIHQIGYSGQCAKDKIAYCRNQLEKQKIQALFVSSLDEIAWLLNLRGSDLSYSPLFFSFFALTKNSATLFTFSKRLNKEVLKYVVDNEINIKEYDDVIPGLLEICDTEKIKNWWLAQTVSYGFYNTIFSKTREVAEREKKTKENEEKTTDDLNLADLFLEERENPYVFLKTTPVEHAKSVKNETEIKGMREAHIKDGLALTRFLYWIEQKLESGKLKDETECTFANALDKLRSQQDEFVSLSFPTISAFGKNAAVIHYRAEEKNCLSIEENSVYLFDSGSQYLHGTTDITRTIYLGKNIAEGSTFQKTAFTLVLKGHIAVASCVFPEGTTGPSLDVLARLSLWENGMDYLHGTGHGVGAFLNVHEGPHGITCNLNTLASKIPLKSGMIVSNEPGFYLTDNFGIRIENLLLVQPSSRKVNFKTGFEGTNFLKFEDLTHVPLQTMLIEKSLLTEKEIEWINDYNERVNKILKKRFEEEEKIKGVSNSGVIDFLRRITAPI